MADRIKGITIEIGGDTTGLNKALSGVNKEIKGTQSQLKDVERLLKLDPSNTVLLSQKHKLLAESVGAAKDKLDTLKTAEKQAQQQFKDGKISQEQYDALKREIVATKQQLETLEDQANKSNVALQKISLAGKSVEEFGGKITDAGKKLSVLSAGIVAAGGASANMAMDFEDAMAQVSTIADSTEVPLSELEKAILDLSNQTGISSTEIANNVYDAISAGQKTGDAVNFISNSTMLAKAGFADAGSALDVLTTIMNSYGLEASEVTKVSDILIQTQNLGKTTVAELSSSMGKIIPTAKANGVALDQVATGYALMTSNGVATAETTTYMNSMLNELGKSGTKVSDTLKKKTGKSFLELMEGGASLSDVLQIVSDSAKKQKLAFGDLWGSAEAGKAGLILLGDSADTFNDTLEDMQNSTGATQAAFNKLQTNSDIIKKSLNRLKNTSIELGTAIMKVLAPILEALSDKIQEASTSFSGLSDDTKKIIVVIAMVVAAIGPLLIVIGQITTGIGGVMAAVTGLGKAFSLLSGAGGPILLTVAAVGALVAIVSTAGDYTDKYREKASLLTDQEQQNKEKVDELYNAYDLLNQRRDESARSAQAEAGHEQELFGELQGITSENGKVKAGYEERAAFITGELARALGIEIEMTGNQIQNYKDLCSNIDQLIVKKQANALLDAGQADYAIAIKEQTDAFMAYRDAQKNVEEGKRNLNEAQRQEARYQMEVDALRAKNAQNDVGIARATVEAMERTKQAAAVAQGYGDKLTELNGRLQEAETQFIGYNTAIETHEGLSAALISGDQQKISEAVMLAANSFEKAEWSTKESLERQVQTLTEKYTEMKASVDSNAPGISQSQVDQMKDLVDRSKAELDRLPLIMGKSSADAAEAAKGKTGAFRTLGEDFANGTAQGIRVGGDIVNKAATDTANDSVDAAKAALDSHSPSRVMEDVGLDYDAGLAGGIDAGTVNVCNKVQLLIASITSSFNGVPSQAEVWGGDMMDGYIRGIGNKIKTLEVSCQKVAGTVSDYMHFTRPEKGPLRNYEEWMPHMMEGLAGGIYANLGTVGSAAKAAADEIGSKLASGLSDSVKKNKAYAKKSAEEIAKAVLDVAKERLGNHKVYNKLTLNDEAAYWDSARKQVKEGTQARIDADEEYFKVKQSLNDKMQASEEKYTDNLAKAYENLNKEVQSLNKEYDDAVDSRAEKIKDAYGLFDEFSMDTDLTSDDLLNNLQGQVDGLKEWRENLDDLGDRGIGKDMLSELQDMGPKSAAQIRLMTEMTDDELDQYVALFRQKNRIARRQAVEELAPMKNDIASQIQDLKAQTSRDLADYQQEYAKSMASLGVALNQPAEAMKLMMAKNAVEMVSGLATAIQTESGSTENTGKFKTIADNILKASGTLQADMENVGRNAIAGIIIGLQSKMNELYAVAQGIAQNVSKAMGDVFETQSPFAVMRGGIGNLKDGSMNSGTNSATDLSKIEGLLSYYLPGTNKGASIVLDDGTLVGKMMPSIDNNIAGGQGTKGRNGS